MADDNQNAMTAKAAATTTRMPAVASAAARSRRNFVVTPRSSRTTARPDSPDGPLADGSGLDAAPTLVLQLGERQRVDAAPEHGDDTERRERERAGQDETHDADRVREVRDDHGQARHLHGAEQREREHDDAIGHVELGHRRLERDGGT